MIKIKIFLLIALGGSVIFTAGFFMRQVSDRMIVQATPTPSPTPTPQVVVIPNPMPVPGETHTQPHTGWNPFPDAKNH
jgi:hypothetical protein